MRKRCACRSCRVWDRLMASPHAAEWLGALAGLSVLVLATTALCAVTLLTSR